MLLTFSLSSSWPVATVVSLFASGTLLLGLSRFPGSETHSPEALKRAGDKLSDLRLQGRQLERSLLTRQHGSTLDEAQLQALKSRYNALRQALEAPNPSTLDGYEAALTPLYQAVQDAREAIDGLQPTRRLPTV